MSTDKISETTTSGRISTSIDLTEWDYIIIHQIFEDYENNVKDIENYINAKDKCSSVDASKYFILVNFTFA